MLQISEVSLYVLELYHRSILHALLEAGGQGQDHQSLEQCHHLGRDGTADDRERPYLTCKSLHSTQCTVQSAKCTV